MLPPGIGLRRAEAQTEAEGIAELERASAVAAYRGLFEAPFPLGESVERWCRFDGVLHVAEAAGELVGFVAQREDALEALYVAPGRWGKGIGGALLELAIGARRLWVLEANAPARRFYERRGWRADGATQPGPEGTLELRYVRPAPVAADPHRSGPDMSGFDTPG